MRRLLAAAVALLAACTGAGPSPAPVAPTPDPPSPSVRVPGVVRFAALGDIGDGSRNQRLVASAIAREHARRPLDFVVLLGDLIYPDGHPRRYRTNFARPWREVLDEGIEMHAVLGNHDIQTEADAIMELFAMPARSYTVTRGPVQLFAVDSSAARIDPEQQRWLDAELARSTAPWKIAFTHVPPYSSGSHGNNPALIDQLVPLLERHGVQMLLAGHDHDYERTRPIRGVTYVVSGGGCCPRRVGRSSFTAAAGSRLHFVVLEASGEELSLRAVGADGRVFDRATLSRSAAVA